MTTAEPMDVGEVDPLQKIEAELNSSGLDYGRRKKLNSAAALLKKFRLYATPPSTGTWKVGTLCKWKPGMSNRRFPNYEDIGIVTSVLTTPISDPMKKDAGNPYFREPLDIVVGFIDPDKEFINFYFDSRRFQPVDEVDIAPRLVSQLKELQTRFVGEAGAPIAVASQRFKVGDAVRWKDGLKNKKRPMNDEPAIVAEALSEPIFDLSKDAGGQYFREPLDLRIAMMDSDVEFVIYHFDSRRFEVVPPGQEGVKRPKKRDEDEEEDKEKPQRSSSFGEGPFFGRQRSGSSGSDDGSAAVHPPPPPASLFGSPHRRPSFSGVD